MIKHIWSQPLHVTMRQYRILPIAITVFFGVLVLDMWDWFQHNHKEMKEWTNTSFSAMVLMCLGAIKWSLEHMTKKQEKDDHDTD